MKCWTLLVELIPEAEPAVCSDQLLERSGSGLQVCQGLVWSGASCSVSASSVCWSAWALLLAQSHRLCSTLKTTRRLWPTTNLKLLYQGWKQAACCLCSMCFELAMTYVCGEQMVMCRWLCKQFTESGFTLLAWLSHCVRWCVWAVWLMQKNCSARCLEVLHIFSYTM